MKEILIKLLFTAIISCTKITATVLLGGSIIAIVLEDAKEVAMLHGLITSATMGLICFITTEIESKIGGNNE